MLFLIATLKWSLIFLIRMADLNLYSVNKAKDKSLTKLTSDCLSMQINLLRWPSKSDSAPVRGEGYEPGL